MYLNFLNLLGIRLEGLPSKILNYVKHEYGFFECAEPRPDGADIVVEFVDDTTAPERSVHVRAPVAHDDRGVFLHDPDYHVVRIDFDAIGRCPCRVTCDVNFNPHFFAIILEYIVHFSLLAKDTVFCHASAFELDGKVALCPAWRNVGKTNVLLSFLLTGARYVADDWSVLRGDGCLYSLPKRLNLLYYNFEAYPELLESTSPQFAALVDFVKRARRGEYDLNEETLAALTERARMRMSPYELFDQVPNTLAAPVNYVFLLRRAQDASCAVALKDIDAQALVHSVHSTLAFEQSHFHLAYTAHKATTGRANALLEGAGATSRRILSDAFAKVPHLRQVTVPSQDHSKEVHGRIREEIISPGPDRMPGRFLTESLQTLAGMASTGDAPRTERSPAIK
jgi:hypothetical protein